MLALAGVVLLADQAAKFWSPGFAQGHVVDFIDYGGLFVGNVADIALTGGCALLMLLSFRGIPLGDVADKEPSSS